MKNKLFCAVVLLLIGCMPLIAKKTTIKFAMGTNVANSELTQKLLKKFEKKNPEIKVDVVRISTSSTDNYAYILQMLQAKSDDMDLFYIDVTWPGDLAGNLLDLNKLGSGKVIETFIPSAVKSFTVNDKLVAYPWNIEAAIIVTIPIVVMVLICQKSIVAGLTSGAVKG